MSAQAQRAALEAGAASIVEPNLESLDALRGFLALYVMLGHARWLLWDGHWQWIQGEHPWWADVLAYASASLRYGHEAVVCFFVLSGFFIHFRWAAANAAGVEPRFDVRDYARRRAHRLLPPYGAALAATVALDLAGRGLFPTLYGARTGVGTLDDAFASMAFTPGSVTAALLLLPGSTGTHFGTNGALWSLAYEFVYYALYPVLLLARARFGPWTHAIVAAVSVVLAVVVAHPFAGGVLLMYPLWLLGAAMAEAMLRGRSSHHPAVLVAILALGVAGFHVLKGAYAILAYVVLGFGAVSLAAALPQEVRRWRVHQALHWLGLRSYTLYIGHFPFLALVSAATFEIAGRRPQSGWLALAAAAAALAWCSLLWWLVERRFMHARLSAARAPRPTRG